MFLKSCSPIFVFQDSPSSQSKDFGSLLLQLWSLICWHCNTFVHSCFYCLAVKCIFLHCSMNCYHFDVLVNKKAEALYLYFRFGAWIFFCTTKAFECDWMDLMFGLCILCFIYFTTFSASENYIGLVMDNSSLLFLA